MTDKHRTPSYIVEYGLTPLESDGFSVLYKAEMCAVSVYNKCLSECLKRMHRMTHDPKYLTLGKEYADCKKRGDSVKSLQKRYRVLYNKYKYTEYDMHTYVALIKPKYNTLGIDECQKLATRAYRSVEKLRTHDARYVRYLSHNSGTSFEGKSHKSKLHFDRDKLMVCYGRDHHYRIIIKPDDQYAMSSLMDRVKYVRILHKEIRGHTRWYAQLVMEGYPPSKNHTYGDGAQGLDEGVSTIASVTSDSTELIELAPSCASDERKIRRIQRAMDRSRRATNPDNYNSDGTISKGHHVWNYSKRYIRLRHKLHELRRHAAVIRYQEHCILANHLIAKGSDIRVEKMQMHGLAHRAKNTTHNHHNGRMNRKKRYGKTISIRAPAMLISIIDRKLHYRGLAVKYIDTFRVKASQYNPLDGSYTRKDLKDRMILVGTDTSGHSLIVQRDMLSAYIIQHTTADGAHIDAESAYTDFMTFKQYQDAEVARLRSTNRLSWYVR